MKNNYFQLLLMVFTISLFANTIFAQGTYVNFNAGYGFKASSQNLDYFNFQNINSGGNSSTFEQVNVSLGKGLNLGGALGYMLNKNFGAEFGLSFLLGGKSKAKDTYTGGTTDYTLSSKMLRINPSIVIASGMEKINPYVKFGLIIGTGSIIYKYNDNNLGNVEVGKMKFNGGIALGLSSSIGAMYNLSDKMSVFGELNMVNLSYAPKKGELTELTYNGIDQLPNMTTKEKETEFVKSYTYNWSSPPPDSQPSQELKQKLPFGSLGLNFGLKISF